MYKQYRYGVFVVTKVQAQLNWTFRCLHLPLNFPTRTHWQQTEQCHNSQVVYTTACQYLPILMFPIWPSSCQMSHQQTYRWHSGVHRPSHHWWKWGKFCKKLLWDAEQKGLPPMMLLVIAWLANERSMHIQYLNTHCCLLWQLRSTHTSTVNKGPVTSQHNQAKFIRQKRQNDTKVIHTDHNVWLFVIAAV